MKKTIYLIALAIVFCNFGFKPAVKDAYLVKSHSIFKKQSLKKQLFSGAEVYFYNPVEAPNYHVKLTNESTLMVYTFDIPQYGVSGDLGPLPEGSYSIDFYSTSDTNSYFLQMSSPTEGNLGGYGPEWTDISIPVSAGSTQTLSITN